MAEYINVTTLNLLAKQVLEQCEPLNNLIVCGEVSNFTRHYKSGHCYFTLKDENAAIKCVMFRDKARLLGFAPENGMLVLAYGRATLYERDGAFQLYCDYMRPFGAGAAQMAFDALYKKLDAVTDGDDLVLAGSIPAGMPGDIYEKIMAALQEKKVRVTVDATGDLLLNVLKYRPFLIKPNQHELGELFGRTLKTGDDIRACAAKLQDKGSFLWRATVRSCWTKRVSSRRSAFRGARCAMQWVRAIPWWRAFWPVTSSWAPIPTLCAWARPRAARRRFPMSWPQRKKY